MLQSFILIHERTDIHSRPVLASMSSESAYSEEETDPADMSLVSEPLLESRLRDMGFRVYATDSVNELAYAVRQADAAVLSVAPNEVETWRKRITSTRSMPILWWCDRITFPTHECKLDPGIDGMLGPGMSPLEMHAALLLSVNHYFQRTEWQQEREQLLSKLEERKWIDQAKRILSEMKHISEAEAYELLRKQAMNDRKRLADVATSIVKVYQLLQEENKGGRKR